MNLLFPEDVAWPEGFTYVPDFIDEQEEEQLIGFVQQVPLKNMLFQGFEAKRKVASFGYDYQFDHRRLTPAPAMPARFSGLVRKVAAYLHLTEEAIAKMLITEYPVGSVINWHRDAPPFELIAGVSLLSDCIFKLRPHDKLKQTRQSVRSFPVQRRSLYIMQGPAREAWQHSIAPVKQLRYSITLRTLRSPAAV